ncbi:MAG TPA: DUF5305 family protein, partial [Egibacteraceae bacterium]|nr:DUF5305 family protein [Egibacteraceae bacterium]
MTRAHGARRAVKAAAACGALLALAALWPAQLGGRTSFLSTVGGSMAPQIREGDLAVVRSAPPYQVGDVVAYRNADLGQIALHRIIEARDGRFRLQGDANTWIDSYEPAESEIVGRLWLHVPKAGTWLDWLRRPRDAALLTALAALLVGTGARHVRRRMRRRRSGEPVRGAGLSRRGPAPAPSGAAGSRRLWLRAAPAGAALVAAGAIGSLVAGASPPLRAQLEEVPYRHTGTFGYDAPATVSTDVLAGEAMRDGAPVYLRLAQRLNLRFAYALEAEEVEGARGTRRLTAVLTDTRGWERELPLRPAATFDGPSFEVAGSLDLVGLQQLIQRFRDQTGSGGTNFQLRVAVETAVEATVAGQGVRDEFEPDLVFLVDAHAMTPEPGEDGEPLTASRDGVVGRDVMVPARLEALGLSVPVSAMAAASRAVLAAGTLLLLVAGAALARSPAERPSDRILRRHGSRILPVERVEPRPDERVVRMSEMRDLVRIADNLEAPVLHLAEGSLHRFLVQEGATTYVVEVDDELGSQRDATVSRLPAQLGAP